jgi:hypothetical protein
LVAADLQEPVTTTVTRRIKPGHETAYVEFLGGISGAALALSWVSAPLALALCGLMALYYAFDQASVPAAAEPVGHS